MVMAEYRTLLLAAVAVLSGGSGLIANRAHAAPASPRDALSYPSMPVVLFAGQNVQVAPQVRPTEPVRIEPALPSGLALDPHSGALRGRARGPAPGRAHVVADRRGATGALWIEVLARPSPRTAVFAAPDGNDDNPGTLDRPFRTVARGAAALRPGMTLYLRAGVYRGATELRELRGTANAPITIRSYPGERAVLDASEPEFAENPRQAWEKAREPGARPDEWVS